MKHPIIETSSVTLAWQQWLGSPAGLYLRKWEQTQLDDVVADLFGYHALQLGTAELAALRANRMPHRWLAQSEEGMPCDFAAHSVALPFQADSLDLVVLPHSLELSLDPHASLREAERVLVPEGHLVITGLNPTSLWGWRYRRAQGYRRLGAVRMSERLDAPACGDMLGYWRLCDWLRLLGFEVKISRFGCWRPAFQNAQWLERMAWMDRLGTRFWPILGGVYLIVAVKRVQGGRLMGASWKNKRVAAAAAMPVARRQNTSPKTGAAQRSTDIESR
ncbi:MAG: methyltransferase domain-containing protein [Betaproteobacteria bacterium]|nr:methyltransferase domain-containing protein [Betaproteobacteria bacterium]